MGFHALDNYFSRQRGAAGMGSTRGARYITYKPEPLWVLKCGRGGAPLTKARLDSLHARNTAGDYYNPVSWHHDPRHPEGVRPEVERGFAELVAALDASPMLARAKKNDSEADGYWSRIIERAARSFENFVIARMKEQGYHNDYLANVRAAPDFVRNQGRYPYLLPDEVAPIAAAFDALFDTIETRETDSGVAMFSRSPDTQAAYEARIDALLAGEKAAGPNSGARVLDRSDVLAMLGFGDGPVRLAEGKVQRGQDNHPHMSAEVWKKVPQWLDHPAAVFDSDTVPGALVLIAPETVNGATVRMTVVPSGSGGADVHILTNAYDAPGFTPFARWFREGLAYLVDQKTFPVVLGDSGLRLPSSAWQNEPGTRKILTEKNLAAYRRPSAVGFSRNSGAGLLAEVVQSVADGITAEWANAPEVVVVSSMADPRVPEAARREDARQTARGATGAARGFYLDGTVFLVAERMGDERTVVETLFHEALGHHGLRGVFGAAIDDALDQVADARPGLMAAKAKDYGKDVSDPQQRREVAEEVLAELAQTRPNLGLVKRAIAAIRAWLRQNMPGFAGMALSDDELVAGFILPARGWVERGTPSLNQAGEAGALRFSRGPARDTVRERDDRDTTLDMFGHPETQVGPVGDLFGYPEFGVSPKSGVSPKLGEEPAPVVRGPKPAFKTDPAAPFAAGMATTTVLVSESVREIGAARIHGFGDVAAATRYLSHRATERFDGIVTDAKGKPLAVIGGFNGNITRASVYSAVLLAEAIRVPGAAAVWGSHNHPSGTAELSHADVQLSERMARVFEGGRIEWKGIVAVTRDQFSGAAPNSIAGRVDHQPIPTGTGTARIPVVTREFSRDDRLNDLPPIRRPDDGAAAAIKLYAQHGRQPGILLLDAMNTPVGYLPMTADEVANLKGGRGPDVIRALSVSNSSGAILVHSGEYGAQTQEYNADAKSRHSLVENLGGLLKTVDVTVLDAIDLSAPPGKGRSAAEAGRNLGMEFAFWRSGQEANEGVAVSVGMAEDHIAAVMADWPRKPDVTVVATTADFPEAVRAEAKDQGVEGVKGAFHRGKLYVVAGSHTSLGDVEATLFHEVWGHYGLATKLGAQITPMLAAVFDQIGGIDAFRQFARKHGFKTARTEMAFAKARGIDPRFTPEMRKRLLVEELVAAVAEGGYPDLKQWVQEFIGKLRAILRSLGFMRASSFTDADLMALVASAREAAIYGKGAAGATAAPTLWRQAWHGAGLKFEKFSTDHIGTGEGHQVYGWGLYFASQREVAEYYRDTVAGNGSMLVTYGGKTYSVGRRDERQQLTEALLADGALPEVAHAAPILLRKQNGNPVRASMDYALDDPVASRAQMRRYLDEMMPGKAAGALYQVELPDNDEVLVRWDAPLADQPEAVRAAFARLGIEDRQTMIRLHDGALIGPFADRAAARRTMRDKNLGGQIIDKAAQRTGEQAYAALTQRLSGRPGATTGAAQRHASMALLAEGVRGVRYPDPQSRALSDNRAPSFNYVVFDANDVEIRALHSAAYGKTYREGAGTTIAQAQAAVARAFEGAENAPKVVIVSTPAQLDVDTRRKLGRTDASTEGAFDPATGTVYLFTDALASPERAAWVALHEGVGHYGILAVLGDTVADAVDRAYGNPTLAALANALADERRLPRTVAMLEALAELSAARETGRYGGIFKRYGVSYPASMKAGLTAALMRLIQAIKRALTGRGFKGLSDADVVNLLDAGREFVNGGPGDGPRGGLPALASQRADQTKTANFKRWFGDWEAVRQARVLQGEPVAEVQSSIVPQTGPADVRAWAASVFTQQGGWAKSPELGAVSLDMRSVRDSMGHGRPSRFKYAAFAAVKDVLERGVVIHRAAEGPQDSIYVSAPVRIDGVDDVVTVLVHRDAKTQRMYLHSVTTKESILNRQVSGADTEASERSGSSDSGGVASVLQRLLRYNLDTVSKVVREDGAPLVVYHGTAEDFEVFEMRRGGAVWGSSDSRDVMWFSSSVRRADVAARDAATAKADDFVSTDAVVMPIYLRLVNPFYPSARVIADPERLGKAIQRAKKAGHDGLIMPGEMGGKDYAVFSSTQIKSAIGNNGDYDPANPSILRSESASPAERREAARTADTWKPIFEKLAQAFKGKETFGALDKSIHTQLHKSRKNKHFARVFDGVMSFMADASRAALRPADAAPTILPRVDVVGGLKPALTKLAGAMRGGSKTDRDIDAAFNAVLAGTLDGEHGKVWKTAEDAGLDAAQWAIYGEFRDAIDASLDEVAASEAFRLARTATLAGAKPLDKIKQEVINDPQGAHELLTERLKELLFAARESTRDALADLIDALPEAVRGKLADTKNAAAVVAALGSSDLAAGAERPLALLRDALAAEAALVDIHDRVGQIFERSAKLKRDGYAPLMRFGQYTLDVVQTNPALLGDEAEERLYFGMFESASERDRVAATLREKYAGMGSVSITAGTKNGEEWKQYQGVSPESVMLFADLVGIDSDAVMQEWYRKAVGNRSTLKRLIHRKKIPGYSLDGSRVLASFIASNGRRASSLYHSADIDVAIKAFPREQGAEQEEAQKLANYVRDPQEEAATPRALMAFHFLGGSISNFFLNLTQPGMVAIPFMAQPLCEVAGSGSLGAAGRYIYSESPRAYAPQRPIIH